MKTILFKSKIAFVLLLSPLMLLASPIKGKYKREKTLNKSFEVSDYATLMVRNDYGNLNITTWDKNTIDIKVQIEVSGNDEDYVEERLRTIDVDFEGSASFVSAITRFQKRNRSWWNWGRKNISYKINYTIQMPVTNNVDLNNDYGGIYLDKLKGASKISCDYGKIDIGELHNKENYLTFDYTNKSTIGYMKAGKINADYSAFTIEKAGSLRLNADYTSTKIHEIDDLNLNSDYGSIKVEKAHHVSARGSYITRRFGTVTGSLSLSGDYGSLKITNLQANNTEIRSDYMSIRIGYDSGYSFDFDIRLEYASLKSDGGCNFDIKRVKSSDRYYAGNCGTASSGNRLKITSEYGSVHLNQN
ncbi:MAG: hypothetical protein OIF50_13815 [Flavobacteriaceae bacterium]|nr:hypothetical protein [Flavobacteriaceae bacterium]